MLGNDRCMATNELQTHWGRRIRGARRRAGLSLREAARRADIDKGQLSRVETGDARLGDEARIRLAAALGRSVAELFPYPDTTDLEDPCPSAASAPAGAPSPTPVTTAARRSPAPSAEGRAASAREENPGSKGLMGAAGAAGEED